MLYSSSSPYFANQNANRAYGSIVEAEAALPATLSDDWEFICEGSTPDTASSSRVFAGYATTSSYTVTFKTTAGTAHRHPGHPNAGSETHFRIQSTAGWGHTLYPGVAYTYFIGLDISRTGNGTTGYACLRPNGVKDLLLDKCLLKDTNANGVYLYPNNNTGTIIRNCLIYVCGLSRYDNGYGDGAKVINCTIVDSGANGLDSVSTYDFDATNCLVDGSGSNDFDTGTGTGSTLKNCAFGDNSIATWGGTKTDCRVSQTFTFEDSSADDYHLDSADAGARGYGDGPDDDADVPASDVDEDSRSGSTCDIGFDEYVSAETTLPLPIMLLMDHFNGGALNKAI